MDAFVLKGSLNPVTDDCAVCQSPLREEGDLVQLACEHFFHLTCIEKWNGPGTSETDIIIRGRVVHSSVRQQKRGLCVLCSQPIKIKASMTHEEFVLKAGLSPSSPGINLQALNIGSSAPEKDIGSSAQNMDTVSTAPTLTNLPPTIRRTDSASSVSTGTFQNNLTSNFKPTLLDGRPRCQGIKTDMVNQCGKAQNTVSAPYCAQHVGQKNPTYWHQIKEIAKDKKKVKELSAIASTMKRNSELMYKIVDDQKKCNERSN